ncbi:MAG: hypothetical protein KBS81_01550 [Spirochaetales bacterium]|nr:hypothetical protein [Candidatus Physcosoma equi]
MNTKKAIWVKRPHSYIKTSLHTYSYNNDEESSVFFTVGEEGNISLQAQATEDATVAFVFLHTPSDYIAFSKNGLEYSFFGAKAHIMLKSFDRIEMRKLGERIAFFAGEEEILSMENPAFLGSASFGVRATGAGHVEISVF